MAVDPNIKVVVADDAQRCVHDVMEIGKIIDLEKFIETSFAITAYNI